MKLSVSLPEGDVDFLDEYVAAHHVASRSAVVRRAVTMLRASELSDDYAAAFDEWRGDEADEWDTTSSDGIG